MVAIYEYAAGRYQATTSFASPRPAANENFGAEITIGYDNGNYYLAVSATGSWNNTGRVYLYTFDGTSWKHQENTMYRGIYNPLEVYYSGEIVWQASQDPIAEGVRGNLWMALEDSTYDGSTITTESLNWLKVSNISTHSSLPTNIAIEDDGSTLEFAYT
jgi:hypothetical protein